MSLDPAQRDAFNADTARILSERVAPVILSGFTAVYNRNGTLYMSTAAMPEEDQNGWRTRGYIVRVIEPIEADKV